MPKDKPATDTGVAEPVVAPPIADDEPVWRTYRYTGVEPVDFPTLGWSPEKQGDRLILFGPTLSAHNLEHINASREAPAKEG